ncbi:MAG: gluconokinase [Vagococcus sp.]
MYPLAIDIGTTNIKFNVFEEYKLVDELTIPIETYHEDFGKVYQSPERIVQQVKRGIRTLTQNGHTIDTIIFSTAMHSIMPIFEDKQDEELLIWLDTQGKSFIESVKKTDKAAEFYHKTGTPIHDMSPFAKIGGFKNKGWFSDVVKWIGMKEYIVEAFTGHQVLDYSMASATGLFNIHEKNWDDDILAYIGISEHQLAELVDTDASFPLLDQVADDIYLPKDTLVFVGASDGALASFASYLANGTLNTVTVGTSGAVRKLTKKIELDEDGQTFCYYLNKDYWVVGGATNNGGNVLEWADKMFYNQSTSLYDQLNDIIHQTEIGSNHVLFYPYIAGERAPIWNSDVQAVFKGLTASHKKEDMMRAIVEGVLFNLRCIGDLVELEPRDISVNGGFFKDSVLTTMTSDVFGRNCIQSVYSEPTFGAICLIQKPLSYVLSEHKRIFFNEDNHNLYTKSYEKFAENIKNRTI